MITVFTPTYNRAYSLPDLYESLCRQTSKDFEWIVVDDGSTDNTRQLVASWIDEAKFPLRYFYQPNAGKHIAINKGVKEAKGDLFFIVDSDDRLADNAVECYLEIFKDVKDDTRYAGISAIRINPNGDKIGSPMPFEQLDCTILDFGMKYKIDGDMAEAYKTEVLRQFPFPQFDGERFITEAVVWIKIAQQALLIRYVNKPLYICEYRADGLSASITRKRIESPKGCMLFYSSLQKARIPFFYKCRAAVNYWRFAIWAKDVNFGDKCKQIGWNNMPFYIIGFIAYLNDKMHRKRLLS